MIALYFGITFSLPMCNQSRRCMLAFTCPIGCLSILSNKSSLRKSMKKKKLSCSIIFYVSLGLFVHDF